MRKILSAVLTLIFMSTSALQINVENIQKSEAEYWDIYTPTAAGELELDVRSAILIEAKTGMILYEKSSEEALAPASVTKTMTLLLIAEALSDGRISLTDNVSVSRNAASMGGSQVFLKEGEVMSVEDLIKCTVIASANDAAVALAEHLAGSEGAFVDLMNARARELGLTATVFENTTGLDDDVTEHTMSAKDIAMISRELLKHGEITKYSSVWQDSIRNGEFTLTNTNRLVRYYDGCTGLKTGSTDKAGFCVSASAKRGKTELIAVVMGAESGSARNEAARALLDFGFSNYALFEAGAHPVGSLKTLCAPTDTVEIAADGFYAVVGKADINRVTVSYELPESVSAPLSAGTAVGRAVYKIGDSIIGSSNICVTSSVERIRFCTVFLNIFKFPFV